MTDQELLDLLDRSWEKDDWDGIVHAMQVLRRRMKHPKEWQGLSMEEIKSIWLGYPARGWPPEHIIKFYEIVETELKRKNT